MAPRSSKSSPASSGPVIDAEWRPVPEPASASTALVVSRPAARPLRARVVRPAATRARATARVACPVCGRPGADVKASLGPVTVKVCPRCARVGHFAAFLFTRVLG